MPSIFSRLKSRDGSTKSKSKKHGAANDADGNQSQKPRWEDAYARTSVEPEEIQELVKLCTAELKARGLDIPFLLLPFRPTSDPSAVRTFVRHFFDSNASLSGDVLMQELRMTEPMVVSGVIKWCWSRLPGGIVGWDAYELFKIGEQDSNEALDSFKTFIPLSVDNAARSSIIFDFFDLLSAIAAHGKANGFGGRKLSRMASWWAFDSKDTGSGFEGGYKEWLKAADATSHLFFAFLRSLSPTQGLGSFATLPMSLQKLLQETEYPPQRPTLLQSTTHKVVMIVDTVSPTPFALLRRSSHFEYRDEDRVLREFADYEDPVQALTDECRRVLKAVSAANQTQAVSSSKHSTSLRDASWSRFEDIGFGSLVEEEEDSDTAVRIAPKNIHGLRTSPASGGNGLGRPTTPSWADFLSSGFVDDGTNSNMLLPPDKVLPPIDSIRQRSSQSHRPRLETEHTLEPGELASISRLDLDDAFWWVWMTSLSPEETPDRKSAFGRCAVIETRIKAGRWLIIEEVVKGAAAEPDAGAYIAEKRGFFSWTRRNKGVSRSKSMGKSALDKRGQNLLSGGNAGATSKTSIAPDQQAKIQEAAQKLQARQKQQAEDSLPTRRGRMESIATEKTNSVFTLQPVIASEASSALKWASKYDKEAIREAYLSNASAGRGATGSMSTPNLMGPHSATNGFEKPADIPEKPAPPLPSSKTTPDVKAAPAPAPKEATKADKKAEKKAEKEKKKAEKKTEKKTEKKAEAETASHPVEAAEAAEKASPAVPSKDAPKSVKSVQGVVPPSPGGASSPESKKGSNRLHKDGKESREGKEDKKMSPPPSASVTGGFRKLFGRKNRNSKLPENAAADLNAMLAADAADVKRSTSVAKSKAPESIASLASAAPIASEPASPVAVTPASPAANASKAVPASPAAAAPTPAPAPEVKEPTLDVPEAPVGGDPGYDASVNTLSRVNTAEAREAASEFSRFDQGPLEDQPAFVPHDSEEEEDEAVPPPIARKRSAVLRVPVPIATPESTVPPAIDRWAQIRKNAADRAQRQAAAGESLTPAPTTTRSYVPKPVSKTTDGDDDTSGEESIESRVARIKARVAELTGNMEGVTGPGSRPLPARR